MTDQWNESRNSNYMDDNRMNHASDGLLELKLKRRLLLEQVGDIGQQCNQLSRVLRKKEQQKKISRGLPAVCTNSKQTFKGHLPPLPDIPDYLQSSVGHLNDKPNFYSSRTRLDVIRMQKPHVLDPNSDQAYRRLEQMAQTKINVFMRSSNELESDSVQAVIKKKKAKLKCPVAIPQSLFPGYYTRGELPCNIEHGTSSSSLSWACPLQNLDYEFYLPIFFDGIRVKDPILSNMAMLGIQDMLSDAISRPDTVVACISKLIKPIRNALITFDNEIVRRVLRALDMLLSLGQKIGIALIPFYKQFLAPMNSFIDQRRNIGDSMDYGQNKYPDMAHVITKTLEGMERNGGDDAFVNIKWMVPTYESCCQPLAVF